MTVMRCGTARRLTHKKRKVNGPVGDGASWNHQRFRTGGMAQGFPKSATVSILSLHKSSDEERRKGGRRQ